MTATPLKTSITMILDRSGSMGGTPLRQAIKSAKALVGELGETDLLSVVIFDDNIETLVAPGPVKDKAALRAAIAVGEVFFKHALRAIPGAHQGHGEALDHSP